MFYAGRLYEHGVLLRLTAALETRLEFALARRNYLQILNHLISSNNIFTMKGTCRENNIMDSGTITSRRLLLSISRSHSLFSFRKLLKTTLCSDSGLFRKWEPFSLQNSKNKIPIPTKVHVSF